MLIVCPNCAVSYQVSVSAIGAAGRSVRCVRCRTVWQQQAPAEAASPAAAATPVTDGTTAAFRAESASAPPRTPAEPTPPADATAAASPTTAGSSLDDMVAAERAETPAASNDDASAIAADANDAPPI